MNTSVSNPDSSAPSAPGVVVGCGWVELGVVVVGCGDRQRGCGALQRASRRRVPGFTPSVANRIAQPTGTSYNDTVLAAGTYYYRVAAEDAAGNVGPASNEASATVGDTQAPSAPGTLSAVGSVGKATLSWAAATDNVGVVRYNVHRGTQRRLHPQRRQPDRAAEHARLRRHDRARQLLLQGHRRRRGRQHRRRLERGERDRARRHDRAERTRPGLQRTGRPAAPSTSAGPAPPTTSPSLRYNVHRGTSAASPPAPATGSRNRPGTSYADSGLATGSYFYKVTAEDAAGNISAASNEATATVADATPPSIPGTLTATAAGSTINLSWGAATDNVGVSRYNLHRGTTQRLHPQHRQPDRATDRAQLRRHQPRPRHLLLQAHRRRRRRQHRPRQQHRHRHRRRHHPTQHPHPHRQRRRRPNQPQLDRRHRQRRRHPLQPPPLHQQRLHPQHRQPNRATHHHQLHRHRPQRRHLLLQAHRRRRRRQHQRPLKPSHRHRHRTPRHRPRRRLRTRHRHRHHASPTNPAPATTAPSPTPPGPAPATANTATPSPSTAPTPPPPSPTPTASTSPPA